MARKRDVRLGTNASPQKDSPSRAIASPPSPSRSLFVSQIVAEEISERKDLDLRTRARAGHVCVCLDDRNWASHRNGMRPKVAGASRRVSLPAP